VKKSEHPFDVVFQPDGGLRVRIPPRQAPGAKRGVPLRAQVPWLVFQDGVDANGLTKGQCERQEKEHEERKKKEDEKKRRDRRKKSRARETELS
jgi:hypothetical protein